MDGSGTGASGTWDTTTNNWLSGGVDTNWTNGGDTAVFNLPTNYTVSLGGNITAGGITVAGSGTKIEIGATSGETDTLTLTQGAVITASRSIDINASVAGGDFTVKSGSARTVVFEKANSFTGTLTIESQARVQFSLATGLSNAASIKFLNSGAGQQQAWLFMKTDLTAAGLSSEGGNGGKIRNNNSSGTLTLTIDSDNAAIPVDSTFGGTIEDNLTNGTGVTALTKAGGNSLTLTGVNTYTGATIVNGGTLALGVSNALATGTAITLGGGTLNLGGFSQAAFTNALTMTAGSTIDFGSHLTGLTLTFGDSSMSTWTGSLSLLNFTVGSDNLSFTSVSGLTEAQLAQISLAGYTATGLDLNGNVQFSAIPEPSTFAMLLGGAGLLISVRRLRRSRA